MKREVLTATHWGNFWVVVEDNEIIDIRPNACDQAPSAIGQSLKNVLDPGCRIAKPAIRKGYLEGIPNTRGRGREPFVEVSWDVALDLAAKALSDVRDRYGNEAIYGGSYGWASAGRFHHAQSQVHGFLNLFGGYTRSVNNYSDAAAQVIIPHVLGMEFDDLVLQLPTWEDIEQHNTELVVCFGGIALKNSQVNGGGVGSHQAKSKMLEAKQRGVEFINISPMRDDLMGELGAEWWPLIPNTDTAIMLAIAYVLHAEGLHDKEFLDKYCVGFERFERYLLGKDDGQPKTPAWAGDISGIDAGEIAALAIRMARQRTLITTSWSLQRAEHGEQPYWMGAVLGAMLGTHGLPGAGVGFGYGATHGTGFIGRKLHPFRWGSFGYGPNPVKSFIPVARISDMLLNPGAPYQYNGQDLSYPDIKLIYWAGGNPFHHHQDLNRLRDAWQKPDCVIIQDFAWTTSARHADIVLPVTTSLERNDFACGKYDHFVCPMQQAVEPYGESKSDFDIFSGLAQRLGFADQFTQGRSEMEWVRYLYQTSVKNGAEKGFELPDFETFWQGNGFFVDEMFPDAQFDLEAFRQDPQKYPLKTPSGKIEIFSDRIAGFDYPDCPGHPVWLDKIEWLGGKGAARYPLHLVSNQPKTRLHSQFDFGGTSRKAKIKDREPALLHPQDGAARGINEGDVIRIFNDRGACLSVACFSENIRRGVVQLATGAWCDFDDNGEDAELEIHGNPNVLTLDIGTSRLAQGPIAHSCLVEIERFNTLPPKVKVLELPEIIELSV